MTKEKGQTAPNIVFAKGGVEVIIELPVALATKKLFPFTIFVY